MENKKKNHSLSLEEKLLTVVDSSYINSYAKYLSKIFQNLSMTPLDETSTTLTMYIHSH